MSLRGLKKVHSGHLRGQEIDWLSAGMASLKPEVQYTVFLFVGYDKAIWDASLHPREFWDFSYRIGRQFCATQDDNDSLFLLCEQPYGPCSLPIIVVNSHVSNSIVSRLENFSKSKVFEKHIPESSRSHLRLDLIVRPTRESLLHIRELVEHIAHQGEADAVDKLVASSKSSEAYLANSLNGTLSDANILAAALSQCMGQADPAVLALVDSLSSTLRLARELQLGDRKALIKSRVNAVVSAEKHWRCSLEGLRLRCECALEVNCLLWTLRTVLGSVKRLELVLCPTSHWVDFHNMREDAVHIWNILGFDNMDLLPTIDAAHGLRNVVELRMDVNLMVGLGDTISSLPSVTRMTVLCWCKSTRFHIETARNVTMRLASLKSLSIELNGGAWVPRDPPPELLETLPAQYFILQISVAIDDYRATSMLIQLFTHTKLRRLNIFIPYASLGLGRIVEKVSASCPRLLALQLDVSYYFFLVLSVHATG